MFTAFPMFSKLQAQLQAWLVQSLVPDAIARQVLGYLTQFAGKANRLGGVGLAAAGDRRSPWCSPSTARSTASGGCAGPGRWASGC